MAIKKIAAQVFLKIVIVIIVFLPGTTNQCNEKTYVPKQMFHEPLQNWLDQNPLTPEKW